MDANEPGLFDLPDPERPGTANRPLRGRNRETWARTATAEVTVIDAGALQEGGRASRRERGDDQAPCRPRRRGHRARVL